MNNTTETGNLYHLQIWAKEQGLMLTVSYADQVALDEVLKLIEVAMGNHGIITIAGCIIPSGNILYVKSLHGRLV